jgi:hypothetical protein
METRLLSFCSFSFRVQYVVSETWRDARFTPSSQWLPSAMLFYLFKHSTMAADQQHHDTLGVGNIIC